MSGLSLCLPTRGTGRDLNLIQTGKLQVETSIETEYPLFPPAVQIISTQFWLKNLHSIFSKPSFY